MKFNSVHLSLALLPVLFVVTFFVDNLEFPWVIIAMTGLGIFAGVRTSIICEKLKDAAGSGDLGQVNQIMEKGCMFTKKAQIAATEEGHIEILKTLIEKWGVQPSSDVFMLAVEKKRYDVVRYLIPKCGQVGSAPLALAVAVMRNDSEMVSLLLSAGHTVRAHEIYARLFDRLTIYRKIAPSVICYEELLQGFKPIHDKEKPIFLEFSELMLACVMGDDWDAVADLLIKAGANVNSVASMKEGFFSTIIYKMNIGCVDVTPLSLAVLSGHVNITTKLLSNGAEPNVADRHGATPLMLAASLGHANIVAALLAAGANPAAQLRVRGETALSLASKNSHSQVIALLKGESVDVIHTVPFTEYPDFVLNTIRAHAPKPDLHLSPSIPQKKEQGARSTCNIPEDQRLLALIDCTVMGSAKDCLAFTDTGIFWHNGSSSKSPGAFSLKYTEFATRTFEEAGRYELSLGENQFLLMAGCSCPRDVILQVLHAIRGNCLAELGPSKPPPRGGKSATDPLGHLTDDQKRSILDLGRGFLLFALQGRKTGARSMDMSPDKPAKKLVGDMTDEQLEWLVVVANMEQEATNAGNSGNHSLAIALFEKVVEKAPWNSIALMSLGAQHAFQRKGKKAIELLEQAARIDPSNSQIRDNLEAVRRDFG